LENVRKRKLELLNAEKTQRALAAQGTELRLYSRHSAGTVGTVPVPGLAVSNAKIQIYFFN